jgi:hypothetical protein
MSKDFFADDVLESSAFNYDEPFLETRVSALLHLAFGCYLIYDLILECTKSSVGTAAAAGAGRG